MKIFIYGDYEDWQKELFYSLIDKKIQPIWSVNLPDERDYDVLVWGVPEEKYLSEAKQLKKVVVPYAGIPSQTRKLLLKYDNLQLHNLHHNAIPTAEMAFSLLLAAAKNIIPADRELRKGNWSPRYEGMPNRLLFSKKVVILGMGAVGSHIAKLCLGMHMHVLATRRNIVEKKVIDGVDVFPASEIDNILSLAEYLVLTLPLTSETDNILSQKRLELLPKGSVIVNIGRGQLIDEKSLYESLKIGKIAAAGIDVWYNYPKSIKERTQTFPSQYPFHELDNVVLSPHRGGAFANYDTEYLRVQHLAKQLNEYQQTGVMSNLVDLKRGY